MPEESLLVSLDKAVGLAIAGTILRDADIAVGFSELLL